MERGGGFLTEDERARMARIDQLAATGLGSIDELLELLTDPSWSVRRSVVAALAALGDAAIGPLVDTLVARRDNEARIAATVDALVAASGEADRAVSALAHHENPAVVADVAQILGRRRSASSVPVLAELTSHPDDNVAVAAIEALGRIGGRAAVDPLVDAVQSGNFFRIFPAIDVLGRSGDPRAIEPLAQLLSDPMYTLEAARALGRTGERGAVGPLVQLLSRPSDAMVRVGALALTELRERSLERVGTSAPIEEALQGAGLGPQDIRRLAHSLAGADVREQVAAACLLGALGNEAAIPVLLRQLDGPHEVAEAAAAALRALGAASVPHLLQALYEGDSAKRQVVLPLLTRQSATQDVVACLADEDPDVRAAAAETLARIGDVGVVAHLFPLLEDEHPRVVQAAIGAIQSLGSRESVRLALDAVRSDKPAVRRAAHRILAYFAPLEALDAFLAGATDDDPRVRDAALQGLAFIEDPRAAEALFHAARDPAPRTRASAMRALGQCSTDVRAPAYLLAGLEDEDAWVRYYACQALGRLQAEAAAAPIVRLLKSDAGQVRVAAVEALSHLKSTIAFDGLRAAVDSEDPDVRRAALIGLGLTRRAEAMPILLDALAEGDATTRLVALSALSELEDPRVIGALSRAARDADESVRVAAIGFLGEKPGPDATRVLIELVQERPEDSAVQHALTVPAEGRSGALLAALENADDDLAPRLTSALARMRRNDATAALFGAARASNAAARKAAVTTLAGLGTREALEVTSQLAAHDPDAEVRRVAALLLAQ